jgi:hypothetical protein
MLAHRSTIRPEMTTPRSLAMSCHQWSVLR